MNQTKLIDMKRKKCRKLICFLLCLQVITCLSFFLNTVIAQTGSYTGIVATTLKEPVQGATIQVKGTNIYTTTNSKGEFRLRGIDDGTILLISCIGYMPSETEVTATTNIYTLTPEARQLATVEIVSSGYQNIPKERATGSFAAIDNKTLNQQTGTDILKRINNVTSGVLFNIGKNNSNPQNNTNITIRGLSTINGPLDPLIVLDGFIYEGNIGNINPNDIENINILKDAAAASIWGARAGNGVIVINTKKGKFNQALSVSAFAGVIMSSKPDLGYLPQMKSSDYIQAEQFLFNNGYFAAAINTPFEPLTPSVEIFLKSRNGLITSGDSMQAIQKMTAVDARDQYFKLFYTKPLTQQYSVTVNGGAENNNYSFGVAYDNTITESYSKSTKINLHLNNSLKIIKGVTLNYGGYLTNAASSTGRPAYNSIKIGQRSVPYLQFTDDQGAPIPVAATYRNSFLDTIGGGKLLDWYFYPTENYKHETGKNKINELFLFAGINYHITPALSADIKYQYQAQSAKNEIYRDIGSITARNTINTFTQLNYSTGEIKYVVPAGGIRTLETGSVNSQTIRGQLNYTEQFGNNQVNVIAGTEIRQVKTESESSTLFGYSTDPLTYTNIDFVNYYPTFINGGYGQIPFSPSVHKLVNRFLSFYSNAGYTLKDRYTITASARKDGSNIFGAATNDKWRPLWSIGGLWHISKEAFYTTKAIPSLTLRATFGYAGNVDLSKSAIAVGQYFSAISNNGFPYVRITRLNNPELRWEKTAQFNLALDFVTNKNILTGTIEYYRKKGTDLYGTAGYDYTAWGYQPQLTRNIAEMKGSGIDVSIHSQNINRTIKWNTTFLFNYNNNKTVKYDSDVSTDIFRLLGSGATITPFIGKSLYAIAAFSWGGLDNQGNPQGYLTHQLSTDYQAIFDESQQLGTKSASIKYIGPATPSVFGNLINSFRLLSFSLSFNISYRFGYYFRKSTISYSDLVNNGTGHIDYAKRWLQPGDEKFTDIPSFTYPVNSLRDMFFTNAEVNVLKADNIRLEYINIAYDIPFSTKGGVRKKLQAYINISNLGILWRENRQHIDPDYPTSIRPMKTLAVGIRTTL